MRSAIVAAAFAAGAIAVPYQKRDIVYDYDIVTVTDVVTVTAGSSPSSSSVAAAADAETSDSSTMTHWGHHTWHPWSRPASTSSATIEPAPSSYSAPSSSAAPTTSTYVAPTTSTYVAPTTTSTSTYVAPSTSEAPSSTSVAPSSSAPATSAASSAVPTSYSQKAVAHHNLHRFNHSAPAIEWDDGLASTAADIAASCSYAHNVDMNGGGYGQNIAAGVEADNITAIITDLFYNGEVGWYTGLYGEAQPDMTNFEHWGHFSQIVWKATTKVGCATQDCTSQGLANVGSDVAPYFTVCNYETPGNYANEYGENVGSPLGEATAQWNTGL